MKVNLNGNLLLVSWRYQNLLLEAMLEDAGIPLQNAKEMNVPELCTALGIKDLPKPDITHCIVYNTDRAIVCSSTVVKHRKDTFDKEKARKYSLAKLLKENFSDKQTRKLFWDAYITRNETSKTSEVK